MWLTLRAMALVLFVSVCAHSQARTLGLYSNTPQGLDAEADAAMRSEVQRLLAPADINVVWKDSGSRNAAEDFELVVVASLQGSCSAVPPPLVSMSAALADTSISDGHILPFFRVDCARVTQMLGARVEPAVLGRALARVMAHEIYHIVARTTHHHDTGVAKAVFSVRDLTTPRFEFDPWSLDRMQPPAFARVSEDSEAATR